MMLRQSRGLPNSTILDFFAGEQMIVVEAGRTAKSHKLKNGDVVKVYRDISVNGLPSDKIRVCTNASNLAYVELGEVDWKWCRTGHSTQGIEVDVGIIAVTESRIATKRWLYTATSRCRKQCVVVYTADAISDCVANDPQPRTLLSAILDKSLDHFRNLAKRT